MKGIRLLLLSDRMCIPLRLCSLEHLDYYCDSRTSVLSISHSSAAMVVVSFKLYSLEQFELTSIRSVCYHSLDCYESILVRRTTTIAMAILDYRMSAEYMLDSYF